MCDYKRIFSKDKDELFAHNHGSGVGQRLDGKGKASSQALSRRMPQEEDRRTAKFVTGRAVKCRPWHLREIGRGRSWHGFAVATPLIAKQHPYFVFASGTKQIKEM
ncbi:MAG: hypothetical protein FWF31_01855 [Desulfobulbus sp.]|nr:hypothetical protein [Desulfobulbus sp.]